jgi:uncharacterized DUF497 family protein
LRVTLAFTTHSGNFWPYKRPPSFGHSNRNRVLIVSFTEREAAVRIISARVATARERKDYDDNPLGDPKR